MYDLCKQVVMILVLALLFLLVLKTKQYGGRMIKGRGGEMLIYIRMPDGNSQSVEVDSDAKVEDLRKVIMNVNHPYNLSFGGTLIHDNVELSDIGIGAESTIDLMIIDSSIAFTQPVGLDITRYFPGEEEGNPSLDIQISFGNSLVDIWFDSTNPTVKLRNSDGEIFNNFSNPSAANEYGEIKANYSLITEIYIENFDSILQINDVIIGYKYEDINTTLDIIQSIVGNSFTIIPSDTPRRYILKKVDSTP